MMKSPEGYGMSNAINRAYQILLNKLPGQEMADWQIAEAILNEFNVPKLGEELAKKCLISIISDISYPTQAITTHIVGRAENLATELWEDLSDEPHMAEFEWKKYRD